MLVVGTYKPNFPINNFVKVIFKEKNNYYIQNYDLEEKKYFFKKIIFKKNKPLIKPSKKIIYDSNIDELIYGYLTEKEKLIVGKFEEIEKDLFKLLNDINLPPMARYLISKQLKLNGKAKLLKIESSKYFSNKNIKVTLTPFKSEFEMIVNDEIEIINKFKTVLKKYQKQILKNEQSIKWTDITDFDTDFKNVTIEKFKINTNTLIQLINNNFKDFLESVIDEVNTYIDFEFENKIINTDIRNINKESFNKKNNDSLNEIIKFIENKNK